MSKCTAAQAVSAAEYWVGYKEKANANYATTRDKSAFTANAGSNNYTYMGYLCGCQGQAWCAATVSTVIYEACGNNKSDAKTVLHGVWPYINVTQVYDAAASAYKGKSKYKGGTWKPAAGDIVIFDWEQDNSRDHTGLVYAVDSSNVYCIEGNSQNMVRKTSYPLSSKYLWGYVRPLYSSAVTGTTVTGSESYGNSLTITLHELSYGNSGAEVKAVQRILYSKYGTITVDGEFGATTKSYVIKFQKEQGLTADGVVGAKTWEALLKA